MFKVKKIQEVQKHQKWNCFFSFLDIILLTIKAAHILLVKWTNLCLTDINQILTTEKMELHFQIHLRNL